MAKPAGYWRSHPVLQLIARGEGDKLEFKETLEWDVREGRKSGEVLHSTLKTVAAFRSSEGGTLLIGVSDSGLVAGLEPDYALFSAPNMRDGFQLKLRDHFKNIDPPPLNYAVVEFETLPERRRVQYYGSAPTRRYVPAIKGPEVRSAAARYLCSRRKQNPRAGGKRARHICERQELTVSPDCEAWKAEIGERVCGSTR